MGVGRSLKDGSQPEYEEKLNRLKQLREVRNGYQNKMSAIKENLRGLDCKSEEELDAKVKELEDRISHGSLLLREEKQVVSQISKLQSQRGQIRDYDNQKSALTELESENSKVKVVIAELESEFTILKAERDQAQGIIKEILTKVKACEAEVKDMEEEQKEVVGAKNDLLASLDKARNELNDTMVDYRDNRSFSLKVRDMVTAGQVEEARALCATQVDEMITKLATDAAFRKEYHALWAAQRRYAVSELLPESSSVPKEAKPDASKPGAKGGKGDKGAKAPPPKPQGAEKARLLIEQLMAEASAEASRKAGARPAQDDAQSSGDADDELDEPTPAPAAEPVAAKPRAAAASARPQDVLKAVELPKIEDVEFVLPVIKTEAEKAAATAEVDKDALREEQRKKAEEAELRKKKAAELKEKKRQEGEVKRKEQDEQRKIEAERQAAEKARLAAEARAQAEARRKAAEAAKAEAEAKAQSLNPAHKIISKSQVTVAAKGKAQPVNYWKQLKKDTNLQLVILAVVLTIGMVGLLVMAARS
ncbi:hypothetical protein HYH03_017328 [Edaphochlamys debaryana]|uniref:Uncharacterized protein n=1 Tax=Edaphochlamys debaryana TaxID=47281 RepID=A0A836BP82_9CHLO|nr:hypothetical protein HYH03_017328 [Edaphochlamys debaryana]|eukprot:KAG2483805.1 hypothetical protein HYH03_017328 [Edaphochlamys debaryana]